MTGARLPIMGGPFFAGGLDQGRMARTERVI
jgi:hypothetical protein